MNREYISSLIVFSLIILVILVFPSPYYDVWYDSEPDYIANSLSIYFNGNPVDYLHPGITLTYTSSLLISLFHPFDSVESMILFLRAVFVCVNLAVFFVFLLFYKKTDLKIIILFLSLYIIYPPGLFFLDILSPNIVLGSLGLVLAMLGLEVGCRGKKFAAGFGVLLAIGVATKFSFLLVALPTLISLLVAILRSDNKKKYITNTLVVFSTFFIMLLLLLLPILPMMPFYLTLWGDVAIQVKNFIYGTSLFNMFLYLMLVIVLLFFSFNFHKKFYNSSDFNYKKNYILIAKMVVYYLVVILLIDVVSGKSYRQIAISERDIFPLLGFVMFAIERAPDVVKRFYFLLFVAAISLKAYTNSNEIELVKQIDSQFTLDIGKLLEKSNNVVFYPTSTFTSKEYFILWADYRYGERRYSYKASSDLLPFRVSDKFDNIHVLNSRSFDLGEDSSDRLSYKVMDAIANYKYTPEMHKNLALNHLALLKKKDICTEPYDDFNAGDTFTLVIPEGVNFDRHNLGNKNTKLKAEEISSHLDRMWSKKCKYKTIKSVQKMSQAKVFIIYVDSNK
ncbi:hypothetical protein HOL24_00850 [bacterium]|jgi:hypothetical protein|nr:hypothetical protein [bacterium]